MIHLLTSPELGVLESLSDITAVGHRVVHGGEAYSDSVLIDDKAIETIDKLSALAPLHNPPNLKGILACREILPGVPQVAVFDTAFHQTMPPVAYMYPLPRELYDKYKIRRYGFHGTSHRYVHGRARHPGRPGRQAEQDHHRPPGQRLLHHRHQGRQGHRHLDGLHPAGRTRHGHALRRHRCQPAVFLHRSGHVSPRNSATSSRRSPGCWASPTALSNDMRCCSSNYDDQAERARLAVDVFCYRLKKYIGAYAAALGGLDVLVFTGGIGENAVLRPAARPAKGWNSSASNSTRSATRKAPRKEALISTDSGRVKVLSSPPTKNSSSRRKPCAWSTPAPAN